MDFSQIAQDTIKGLGGKDNIISTAHCSTRLRVVVKNEEAIDKDFISNIEGVKGQFAVGGQYQIIFGAGTVNSVYDAISPLLSTQQAANKEQLAVAATAKQPLLQRLVKGLADIFVPIIPAIVAGGLLLGLNNIFTSKDLFFSGQTLLEVYPQWSDFADLVNTFAAAPFVFLPILLGFSATKKFGGNPYLGATLGMLLVHPALADGWNYAVTLAEGHIHYWNILGVNIAKVGYQGTVIPVLVAAWVLATLEKNIRKHMPSALDNLLTPLLALFITGLLAFTVIGPLGREAGDYLAHGLTWLYNTLGFIGGAIFGTLYAPIVITGMHQTFIGIETQLLASVKETFIFPIAAMSNVAQGAACLAVALIVKDPKTRGLAIPSGISAVLGITEPAMFGVNLKLRYPFLAAIIGSGVSSAFISFFHVKATALGAAGFIGFVSIKAGDWGVYIIGMTISFMVAFALTCFLGKREEAKELATKSL